MANAVYVTAFPSVLHSTRLVLNSSPLPFSQARRNISCKYNPLFHDNLGKRSCVVGSPFLQQPLIEKGCSSSRGKSSISGDHEEDNRAVETVLKLYIAIKNQNIRELSDIIGDECRCVCNFFSFFQPFQGKQQVLDFFGSLIQFLGNNFEFVVQPTLHDGLNVGVAWRLQWNKTDIPLGKGFSFYILQVYQGRVVIRNVEMFMEPLLHIEPLRMKIMGHVMNLTNKLSFYQLSKDNMKRVVLGLFLMAIILLFLKPGLY